MYWNAEKTIRETYLEKYLRLVSYNLQHGKKVKKDADKNALSRMNSYRSKERFSELDSRANRQEELDFTMKYGIDKALKQIKEKGFENYVKEELEPKKVTNKAKKLIAKLKETYFEYKNEQDFATYE